MTGPYIPQDSNFSSDMSSLMKTKVFLSGNPEYEKELMHIKGSNVYWGFLESLKWVYKIFDKMHTGNVSDYILWFVIIMGVFFILLGVL